MNGIKKYACHRVYDNGYNHYLPQSVVTIAPDGEVLECKPLTEEISSTEWIGGVIVLKPMSDGQTEKRYALHISDFDFQQEAPTPKSIITRLPFSV
jgi:hypothetical protein